MTLALRDGVSMVDTEYGLALLDEDSGRYWNLNPSGALVLRTLLAGATATGAARALTERYAVDRETSDRDVRELMTDLQSAGLVRQSTPAAVAADRPWVARTTP